MGTHGIGPENTPAAPIPVLAVQACRDTVRGAERRGALGTLLQS